MQYNCRVMFNIKVLKYINIGLVKRQSISNRINFHMSFMHRKVKFTFR